VWREEALQGHGVKAFEVELFLKREEDNKGGRDEDNNGEVMRTILA